VVASGADGKTTRLRMLADRSDAFSLKVDMVPGDFRYHVEAGEAVSPDYQITTVEPVELAADSPTITVTPPEYARAAVETEVIRGCVDMSALQYSRVAFAFQFTRPAVAASVEWKPAMTTGGVKVFPLELSAEKQESQVELAATAEGTFRVILEAEHGIRTELETRTLTVKMDLPPAFIRVAGAEDIQAVHPYEVLPLEVDLADDVGVDSAEVEYRVNDGPSIVEAMQLDGRGTRQAKGRLSFALSGKVKEGDTVHYRFKAADNRRVPEVKLGPNVVYHPPETSLGQPRWRTLKIAREAAPLKQQQVTAQHEDVMRRLESIQKKLREEQTKLRLLRTDTKAQAVLKSSQTKDLTDVQKQNRAVESDLRELVRDLAEAPALQPVAESIQDLADQEVTRGGKDLQQAQKETEAEARDRELKKAGNELADASKKLDELRRQNDQLAQARQAQAQLESLANRQQQLAERTANDPENQRDPRELEREQQELAKDLRRQSEQNDSLRQALDAARAEQAKQMAARARELAKAERDLAEAERDQEHRQKQDQLADLARQQQTLAEKASRFAQESRQAVQAARARPLKPDDVEKAADALRAGDAPEALQRQDRAARELDRLANDLQRGIDLAQDPRDVVRRLSRLQEDLRKRLNQEVAKKDPKEPLEKRLEKLQPEQQAIGRAVEMLPVPEKDQTLKTDRQEAAQRAKDATEALQKGDPRAVEARMKVAQQALERLANRLPTVDQRQERAPNDVRKPSEQARQLAQQQRDLRAAVERNTKTPSQPPSPPRDNPVADLTHGAAQKQARQQDLHRQTGGLTEALERLAQEMARVLPAQQAAQQAARSSQQAQTAMQEAQNLQRLAKPSQARQSQEQAAQALDQAARQAEQAGQQMAANAAAPKGRAKPQAGQELQTAQEKMGEAQQRLSQGQNQTAGMSMRQAAEALAQAARQFAPPLQPGRPNGSSQDNKLGALAPGEPDLRMFDKNLKKYAGKSWGDLPGELRTKIIQDMKAKYGDDYARIIKLYFEQIADQKK
jgi:hypothetical protein